MKYIFKHIFRPTQNLDIIKLHYALYGSIDDILTNVYIGSVFLPNGEEDDIEFINKNNLKCTDYLLFRKNIDNNYYFYRDMESFFPSNPILKLDTNDNLQIYSNNQNTYDNGILGNWNDDIKKNAIIYYLINDDIITEMFMVNDPEINDITGVRYIININGKMMDAQPEEGDIIFSSKREAEEYIKINK